MTEKITVAQLQDLCLAMFKQKAHVAELKLVKTTNEKQLSEMQEKIIFHLDELELKNFDTGFGKISKVNKPYAKITDKAALSSFLKEKGIYEDLVTFNAAKMNSFYNEEMAKAKEEMDLDFKVDGMDVSSNRVSLSVTKVKI